MLVLINRGIINNIIFRDLVCKPPAQSKITVFPSKSEPAYDPFQYIPEQNEKKYE